MIQVYADNMLAYDSRLEDYDLLGLKVTRGVNKGGTAEIVMPSGHPAFDKYDSYSTIVEVYRDGLMKFRGRALYPDDDFYNNRTIVCEGELCFFEDSVSRPYLYQDAPAAVFEAVVGVHNSQADAQRQFKVGTVTVTDPNDYIRLESENAESVKATLDKLLERCGGYFVFTTDPDDGLRVINWYESMGYRSSQVIEFGENLLDFARSGANTSLATAVLPYGAKDTETGERVTIESVNNGLDYIQDDAAVALRGFIIKPVVWDDVTVPANLLRKAQQWLEENRYIITALELTALDLSYMDKSIDSFQEGDTIAVKSKSHNLDEEFLLTDMTEDLLSPEKSKIQLGKDRATLTNADVAGDKQNSSALYKETHQIVKDYNLNIANVVREMELTLTSLIEQTSNSILLEVSQQYTSNDQLEAAVSTKLTQLSDQFLFEFESLKATVDENDAEARQQFEEFYSYISFENGNIKLGAGDSAVTLTLEHDVIAFKRQGATFGWWDGENFHTGNIVVEVNERAQFGNFAFVPRSNGSLSFLKVDDSILTNTIISISATYTGGDVPVGTALDALTGLTVTGTYSDGSTAEVTGYALAGTIEAGTNMITVTYEGKTARFTVVGTANAGTVLGEATACVVYAWMSTTSSAVTIKYADYVKVVDGAVSLVSEQSASFYMTTGSGYSNNNYEVLRGKYVKTTNGIYYIDPKSDYTHKTNVSVVVKENIVYSKAYLVSVAG